jgi:ribosome maturation protein SDO1
MNTIIQTQIINFCSNCQFNLIDENYKDHCKSEFHLYNLKRRLLELEPLLLSDFI